MTHFLLLASAIAALADNAQPLPFNDGKWQLIGDSTRIETIDGRQALRMETGNAIRRDVQLQDGTIDADVKVSRRRSFVYLNFRMQSDGEYEEFYLRPHKSNLPDATQYAPVYQGQSAWQLYHGARGTTLIEIEPDKWLHLRIVLSGARAAFFLGDTVKPFMVIPHLARAPKAGYIELAGFLPAGTPGKGAIAWFSNISVRPNVVSYSFDNLPALPSAPAGLVPGWQVGESFVAPDTAISEIDSAWVAKMKIVPTDIEGFVELHRYVTLPKDARYWGVVARAKVFTEKATTRRFDLGFSDRITVFLNGQPIFYRDDSYDYTGRRDGLIGPAQATVYLPLQAGSNDISIVVTDRFGGWAIMGSFPEMGGLRISAR
jgi:hypothetical protein